jgi:hypothetical protein
MHWYQDEEEEEDDLMFSPALLARRASESWIDSAPIEVDSLVSCFEIYERFLQSRSHIRPFTRFRTSPSTSPFNARNRCRMCNKFRQTT